MADRDAVLLDWGGVMTGDLFGSFATFCERAGLEPSALADLFRHDRDARRLLIDFECGAMEADAFEAALAPAMGLESSTGLIAGLMAGVIPDETMVAGVRALRERGVPTAMVSNSWGTATYPRELLGELFDALVISGDEGFRKPDPRMYELGASRLRVAPQRCVFVDDLVFNLEPARELGMAAVHHTSPRDTLAELDRLLA